jgi:hypothetical protein
VRHGDGHVSVGRKLDHALMSSTATVVAIALRDQTARLGAVLSEVSG